MSRACSCRPAERGVALVIALLVLGVMTALATLLASEYVLGMRRSENLLRAEQAWEYLLGAEELATLLLETDGDGERDHLGELWAQGMQAYPIDGGWLRGGLEDLQGRFNVNGLKRVPTEQGLPPPVPATEAERRFMRLLRRVGGEDMDDARARALTEALIDWIDSDIEETGFGGAEDSAYARREPPFRPANRPLSSLSELRLLPEMTPELFAALEPLLSVWPPGGSTININTATPAVLSVLGGGESLEPLGDDAVEQLLEQRGEEGYEDIDTFIGLPVWTEAPPKATLSMSTKWFLLRTEVEYGGLYWQMQSILQREGQQVRVITRAIGGL